MGFIQASIKNVLNTTKEIRKASGKIAISGAKRVGNLLENGATFFKKIAERYEQSDTATPTTPQTPPTPAPVAVETPPVAEATPEPVEAETATTIAEQVLDEETPAAELNENSLIVYRAIQDAFNQNGETPSQGKIADMTGFSKSTVSRHVGLLEEGGYIKRADDKTRKIILTDKKLEA